MYRVICNEALKHLQWIVARDNDGRTPIMAAGPFAQERVANMHCAALNREAWRVGPKSDFGARIRAAAERCYPLVAAGWTGTILAFAYPPHGRHH